MKIVLIAVGKMKVDSLHRLCEEYIRRIQPYTSFEVIEIKDGRGKTPEAKIADEEKQFQAVLQFSQPIWLLDERGLTWDSQQLAKQIAKWQLEGVKKCQWVLGGAFGIPLSFKNQFPSLQLSALTFTHEMARLIFCEQIYRSYTILKGHPYHH